MRKHLGHSGAWPVLMNFKVLPRVWLHNGLQEAPTADDTFYLLRLAGLRSGNLPTLLEGNSAHPRRGGSRIGAGLGHQGGLSKFSKY